MKSTHFIQLHWPRRNVVGACWEGEGGGNKTNLRFFFPHDLDNKKIPKAASMTFWRRSAYSTDFSRSRWSPNANKMASNHNKKQTRSIFLCLCWNSELWLENNSFFFWDLTSNAFAFTRSAWPVYEIRNRNNWNERRVRCDVQQSPGHNQINCH